MEIKGEQIIFLLGAGASAEAKIPISPQMVSEVEELIEADAEWKDFNQLYNYLKSSIIYSEGIFGNFNIPFNIEKLLVVIAELEKRDKNLMYPFIGSWNIRLLDLAGSNFENISRFKSLIRTKLNSWVKVNNYEKDANYYSGFISLSREIGNMMKVFSFNYDLCFEKIVGKELNIETGFDNVTRNWHYGNFENEQDKHYLLYKLHGSVDWYQDKAEPNKLFRSDDPVEKPELIFGILNKLNSMDPYLYYTSEFRRATLTTANLIITVGYSFEDTYANNILTQALNSRDDLKILHVTLSGKSKLDVIKQIKHILKLEDSSNQIEVYLDGASDFMLDSMNKEYLSRLIIKSKDAPF